MPRRSVRSRELLREGLWLLLAVVVLGLLAGVNAGVACTSPDDSWCVEQPVLRRP